MSPLTKMKTAATYYKPHDFSDLLGTPGFSDTLLKNHFKLYESYVKNSNELIMYFNSFENDDRFKDPLFADRKRRFGWEFNGMRLHEYYFSNLTRNSVTLPPKSTLLKKIVEDFESFENWSHEFMVVGAMRGIGWAILAYDEEACRLYNLWINEHDLGILAGVKPILVMDVFEHAFMTDYGLERDQYISAFMDAINWTEAAGRFDVREKI